jgi:NADH/NAD ratio-sensing transcriptional regulator Rex
MKKYSKNQLRRYPIYLSYFQSLQAQGVKTISSPTISAALGYSQEEIRKDLQAISRVSGKPRKGRNVRTLIDELTRFLGYNEETRAVLIGAAEFGQSLIHYPKFNTIGVHIVAAFDVTGENVGKTIHDVTVRDIAQFKTVFAELNAQLVIIATDPERAQEMVELADEAGAIGCWNFTTAFIVRPERMAVVDFSLPSSYAIMRYEMSLAKRRQ